MEAIPRRNLELKVRCTDLATLRAKVRQLCGGVGELELQTDTYFHVTNGRLKLREIQDRLPLLIWYRRPDQADVRASDYQLVPVTEPAQLKAVLTGALGLRGVVKKRREIYLWHNVRIHLDEVENLGMFLEFEAVLSPADGEEVSRERLQELTERLQLGPAAAVAESYADLLGV